MTITDRLCAAYPHPLSDDARRLLDAIVEASRLSRSTRAVAAILGVNPNSLMAVLYRAHCASTKQMLDAVVVARLTAGWTCDPARSHAAQARLYRFSSTQALNRFCRRATGGRASALIGVRPEDAVARYWSPALTAPAGAWTTLALPITQTVGVA